MNFDFILEKKLRQKKETIHTKILLIIIIIFAISIYLLLHLKMIRVATKKHSEHILNSKFDRHLITCMLPVYLFYLVTKQVLLSTWFYQGGNTLNTCKYTNTMQMKTETLTCT